MFKFQINPAHWNVIPGYSQSNIVNFGARTNTSVGTYFLNTTFQAIQKESEYVNKMPLLGVQVTEQICDEVYVSPTAIIYAPVNSFSSPIIIDFRNCFPVEEVTVIASISKSKEGKIVFDLVERQQTLYNNGGEILESESYLAFVIKNYDKSVKHEEEFELSFKIMGKNGESYKKLNKLRVIAQN